MPKCSPVQQNWCLLMSLLFLGELWEQPSVGRRVEEWSAEMCRQPRGLGIGGAGGSKNQPPKGWCRGVWDSWRCSMEGQEGAGAWGKDLPRAVSTWIVISTRFSFQWFCTRALLLPSVGLQPAADAGPCYPVSLNFCGRTFPNFFQPFYCGNLCILSVCCQVLLEVSLIHKDLFKAILSEAWRKFSHHLPSWMYNKHLYHLLNS